MNSEYDQLPNDLRIAQLVNTEPVFQRSSVRVFQLFLLVTSPMNGKAGAVCAIMVVCLALGAIMKDQVGACLQGERVTLASDPSTLTFTLFFSVVFTRQLGLPG